MDFCKVDVGGVLWVRSNVLNERGDQRSDCSSRSMGRWVNIKLDCLHHTATSSLSQGSQNGIGRTVRTRCTSNLRMCCPSKANKANKDKERTARNQIFHPLLLRPTFTPPPTYAVWVNTHWLLSLVISITCAFLITLLHQWARRYLKVTQSSYSPHMRAKIYAFFF